MVWALLGILIGILLGLGVDYTIPFAYTKFTAVVLVGILDALFGAIRAEVTKDQYDAMIFISGLFFNIVLALVITYLGDKLGLDLYLAATVVFTFRIFSNVGITRRALLTRLLEKRRKVKEENSIVSL
ncbi:MAG: small basic family protein [Candidatus Peregrinibacteria bacterium]|nr:small basic family protein [Candidatus Peregrinibacteria bacterium]